jgi:hypothetical protein
MISTKTKARNQIIFVFLYVFLISVNTKCAKVIFYSPMTEWWINTTILFLFIALMIYTFQKKTSLIYKILAIPVSWIIHAILSVPAALVLGILKFDPKHIRTAGEHRAVFILASIPILIYFMRKSKLFQK